ncbi:MAG: SprT-like domain-containing protein [Candidatus Ornithospirochaeta sp.]
MDQTIRVTGDKEKEARIKLKETERELRATARREWGIEHPLYDGIYFVVFPAKDRLGEYRCDRNMILLSEKLLREDFSVLRNVFLHEAAHSIDFHLNRGISGHSPEFRSYCRTIGVDEGFEKAKVNTRLEDQEKRKEKIEKLMALSSSPFENEAMTALSKARKLLLENSVPMEDHTEKEDKIYHVDLYQAGRVPFYASRLASFVGKATGCFIVKILGEGNDSILRSFGKLEEVEASLYLFSHLITSLDSEIKAIRKSGRKVTRDSFVAGACPEMEAKLYSADASSDSALVIVQKENRSTAIRLSLNNSRLTTSRTASYADRASMDMGKDFGRRLDFSKSIGRKEIKG